MRIPCVFWSFGTRYQKTAKNTPPPRPDTHTQQQHRREGGFKCVVSQQHRQCVEYTRKNIDDPTTTQTRVFILFYRFFCETRISVYQFVSRHFYVNQTPSVAPETALLPFLARHPNLAPERLPQYFEWACGGGGVTAVVTGA